MSIAVVNICVGHASIQFRSKQEGSEVRTLRKVSYLDAKELASPEHQGNVSYAQAIKPTVSTCPIIKGI